MPMIIQDSTGGGPGLTLTEARVPRRKPEMAYLNIGSMLRTIGKTAGTTGYLKS